MLIFMPAASMAPQSPVPVMAPQSLNIRLEIGAQSLPGRKVWQLCNGTMTGLVCDGRRSPRPFRVGSVG